MLPYMVNKDVYNKWELCGAFCSTPITWIRQRHWSVCSVGYLVLMHRTASSTLQLSRLSISTHLPVTIARHVRLRGPLCKRCRLILIRFTPFNCLMKDKPRLRRRRRHQSGEQRRVVAAASGSLRATDSR